VRIGDGGLNSVFSESLPNLTCGFLAHQAGHGGGAGVKMELGGFSAHFNQIWHVVSLHPKGGHGGRGVWGWKMEWCWGHFSVMRIERAAISGNTS